MSADTINKNPVGTMPTQEVRFILAEASSLIKLTNLIPGDGSSIKIGSGQPSSTSFNFGGFQHVTPLGPNQVTATTSAPIGILGIPPNYLTTNDTSPNQIQIKPRPQFGDPSNTEVKRCLSRHQLLAKSSTVIPANVSVSPNFFIKGSAHWLLSGTMCFNFQDTSLFHVILTLGPGRTEDRVQLQASLKSCPKSTPAFVHLSARLTSVLVTMKFFNADENVVETKSIKIQKSIQVTPSWNSFSATNDSFMSTESFLKICELRKKSEICFFGTSDEFEYVLVHLNIQAQFKEDPSPLKSCTCEQITPCLKLNFNVSSSVAKLDSPSVNFHEDLSTATDPNQFQSKYMDMVVFKVGQDPEQSFLVYKSILTKCSPVFRKMFQIEMQEKSSGEIKLPNRSPEEMEAFLDFLYSDVAISKGAVNHYSGDASLLISVLELAHLYEIQEMLLTIVNCIVALEDHQLTVSSAMQIFLLGHQYLQSDLKFRAVQWIKVNRDKVFTSEGQKEIENNLSGVKEVWAALVAELLAKD